MTRKKFYRLAATWQAFIGLPSGVEPSAEAVQEFLESCEHVEFAGPCGDVLARAYWRERDYEGNLTGGCISIPHKRLYRR